MVGGGSHPRSVAEARLSLSVPCAMVSSHFPDGKHDYGAPARAAMDRFVARHFALDAAAADKLAVEVLPVEVLPVEVLPVEDLRAINAANPLPDHALAPGTLPQFQARQPDANRRILVRTARAAA